MTVLARHGIGVVDDEFIKHEAGDRARAEHLRGACEDLGTMFIKLGQALSTRRDLLPDRNDLDRSKAKPWGRAMTASVPQDENTIVASVTIQRPVDKVFKFYRDFKNLPSFLGDVMAIEQIDPATSRWTIEGPLGIRAHWTVKVTDERPNQLIRYETVTPAALRTYWEINFAPGHDAEETEVQQVMKAPLGRLGRAALALIGKFPAEEVHSNLHRLKQVMETGRVTDTSYSVAGKFGQRPSQHGVRK